MRTIEQAIADEADRYLIACRVLVMARENERTRRFTLIAASVSRMERRVHIHAMALRRLRHYVITPHEAVCAATPSTHAYSDLDGYGR